MDTTQTHLWHLVAIRSGDSGSGGGRVQGSRTQTMHATDGPQPEPRLVAVRRPSELSYSAIFLDVLCHPGSCPHPLKPSLSLSEAVKMNPLRGLSISWRRAQCPNAAMIRSDRAWRLELDPGDSRMYTLMLPSPRSACNTTAPSP